MKKKIIFINLLLALFLVVSACSTDNEAGGNQTDETPDQGEETNDSGEENEDTEDDTDDELDNEDPENDPDDVVDNDDNNDQDNDIDTNLKTVNLEGMSFSVPDHYAEQDYGDAGFPIVGFYINPETGANFNLVVEALPPELELDLRGYIELALQNSGNEIDYHNTQFIDVVGNEWAELTGTTDGFPLKQRVIVHNDNAYVFSYAAPVGSYEESLPEFEKVIETAGF